MEKTKLRSILLVFLTLTVSSLALADTTQVTVTFKVPAAIAFGIAYAGGCSAGDFAFVESDSTFDGNQDYINVTQIDGTACQSNTLPAINITNNGNTNINITGIFTSALPSGTTVKVSQVNSGYEATCSETEPPTTGCATLATTSKTLITNLADGSSKELWWWCDMSNFNSGAAGSDTRTLNLTSVQS